MASMPPVLAILLQLLLVPAATEASRAVPAVDAPNASVGAAATAAAGHGGKVTVHLVPHSHEDVGWLKTIDQYLVGSNNSIQVGCVMNTLDSVVEALARDPARKFVVVEQVMLNHIRFRRLTHPLHPGFLPTVVGTEKPKYPGHSPQASRFCGGWCMHDEAAAHYIDMIDQTTLGHRMIKKQFNKTPKAGWQIDPFGHSAVQAYLLGVELGFDSMHFARIDYQDKEKRKEDKGLEVVWHGSRTFGSSSQIFTNAFPNNYSPPKGFGFEVSDEDMIPVQDDPSLFDYNVEERVKSFVSAAKAQANVTHTNDIMWTMGDDFSHQYAESWFRNMDKLIHHVNKDGQVHALYSTPSIYTDAKHASNVSWPVKNDDFFPYADADNSYWTGYFASRPTFKRYVRMLSGYYLAARQVEFFTGKSSLGLFTSSLEDALGIAQHHDAITGTAKQHTTDDYSKRLAFGASKVEKGLNTALSCLTSSNGTCMSSVVNFSQCQLLNMSYCPSTEEEISAAKSLVVVAYNPLGWERSDFIRIPVNDENLVVKGSDGTIVEAQLVEIDNFTIDLRKFYVKAYLGLTIDKAPKYSLVFQASVPPMGWNSYFISRPTETGHNSTRFIASMVSPSNETIEVGPGPLKMSFSSTSGQLTRIFNSFSGVDLPVQQSFFWYRSSIDAEGSGAYIFRPEGNTSTIVSRSVPLKVIHGPLVDEVHQQFSSWIYQVTRLYKNKDHAEVEYTIGPIPVDDNVGKEVITQLKANMVTNSTFYTDSNGRDFLKRVRDYREEWKLQVHQPIAGNYYPVNLGVYVADEKYELSVLVDRAVGASSIQDGQIEIMLHRRIIQDDGKGVGEALNEAVCVAQDCRGLMARGTYYVNVEKLGHGAQWRRTFGQQVYSPFLLAFTHEDETSWKSYSVAKASMMDANYSLPKNVAIITLQNLDDGTTLLRLAHLFQAAEDPQYSVMAKVELRKVFGKRTIKQLSETNLSANQKRSDMKKKNWKVVGDTENGHAPVKGGPVDSQALVVELGPMEIRTFLLQF
ncbi:hypothetical protein ACP70R_008625 [Stipagrostis hirtigluma subsp. patula]